MRVAGASLALPQGIVTRECKRGQHIKQTTIDLVFLTKGLQDQVLKCRVAKEIEQSSDHLSVKTLICLPAIIKPHAKTVRFTFNEMDEELFLSSF
jgi:hypothetical protein